MIKTRILLASVLKPIHDPRMFEKLGVSLAKLPDTEVHICGFEAPAPASPSNLVFHALFSFSRLSITRFLAPLKLLNLLFRIKPHLVVITTHELLLVSILYKTLYKCDLVYDIQENYYLNITTQQVYPTLIRNILAGCIRLIEKIAAPYIHTFFLAEKSYAQELPFLQNRFLILENKFKPLAKQQYLTPQPVNIKDNDTIQLLYSGTISELYGIFEAIQLAEKLHEADERFNLLIIGYCPQPEILNKVHTAIQGKAYIKLIGGGRLVPHHQIIQSIQESQIGLLPYRPHPSLFNCAPTKLFEYVAHSLPIISSHNPYWQKIIDTHQAGISINYQTIHPKEIIQQLLNQTFYATAARPDVFWETEESKLWQWYKSTYPAS